MKEGLDLISLQHAREGMKNNVLIYADLYGGWVKDIWETVSTALLKVITKYGLLE